MLTIEKIAKIARSLGLNLEDILPGRLHTVLDEIDLAAGMDTRGALINTGYGLFPINTVGARLARHERRLKFHHSLPYHFLGKEAEDSESGCNCRCHKTLF